MSVCVLGSINLDIVASVEALPLPGETVSASRLEHFPGGKGANQAIAAAHMGVDCMMIGAVGTDDPADKMLTNLTRCGVNISLVKMEPSQPTGQAFINVSASGENAIVIVPGANATLRPEDIASEQLVGNTVFLAQLENPVDAVRAFFNSDAAKNGTTILNAAPALDAGADLFTLVDILIVNETELAAYAALSALPETQEAVTDAAQKLIKRAGQMIVVTLGANGVVAISETQSELRPSPSVSVMDTTGAGDCFCGVLAASLAEGLSVSEAISMAISAAAISVGRAGAATSMPNRDEVREFLTAK